MDLSSFCPVSILITPCFDTVLKVGFEDKTRDEQPDCGKNRVGMATKKSPEGGFYTSVTFSQFSWNVHLLG